MRLRRFPKAILVTLLGFAMLVIGYSAFNASADEGESGGADGENAPDLVVKSINIEKETVVSCVTEPKVLGVRTVISNTGPIAAGPFVVEVNGAQQDVSGLDAMSEVSIWFEGYVVGEDTEAEVDVTDTVDESREFNNVLFGPLPVPTPLPTCTPEPEPGLPGDASCDETVNAIDASLILQVSAALLDEVPCPADADVNGDGNTDAVDASLILQFTAGLLDGLPA